MDIHKLINQARIGAAAQALGVNLNTSLGRMTIARSHEDLETLVGQRLNDLAGDFSQHAMALLTVTDEECAYICAVLARHAALAESRGVTGDDNVKGLGAARLRSAITAAGAYVKAMKVNGFLVVPREDNTGVDFEPILSKEH